MTRRYRSRRSAEAAHVAIALAFGTVIAAVVAVIVWRAAFALDSAPYDPERCNALYAMWSAAVAASAASVGLLFSAVAAAVDAA